MGLNLPAGNHNVKNNYWCMVALLSSKLTAMIEKLRNTHPPVHILFVPVAIGFTILLGHNGAFSTLTNPNVPISIRLLGASLLIPAYFCCWLFARFLYHKVEAVVGLAGGGLVLWSIIIVGRQTLLWLQTGYWDEFPASAGLKNLGFALSPIYAPSGWHGLMKIVRWLLDFSTASYMFLVGCLVLIFALTVSVKMTMYRQQMQTHQEKAGCASST